MFKNIDSKKLFISIIAVILITALPNAAQFDFSFSTDQEYSDNPFHSPVEAGSIISSANLGSELDLDAFKVGYYGSYYAFGNFRERNFYWHQIAAWKEFENSTLGFYSEQRINGKDYSYFDYVNVNAYYRQNINTGGFFISLTPYLSYTKYSNISILNNYKATFSYFINRGFETGTTFILGGAINFKKYTDPQQSGSFSYLDESNQLLTEFYHDKNINSLSQLVSYVRAAQSITPTTGLAFQFTNKSILNGFTAQVKELNTVYGDESEIFDDPVNNEGNSVAFELTQILFEDMTVKTGYYINYKKYPSQGLYDINGNYDTEIMRSDKQNIFGLSVYKSIELDSENGTALNLGLNYRYISNNSNSYWFNYKSNSFNVSMGLEF